MGDGAHSLALVEVGAGTDHQGVLVVRQSNGAQRAAVTFQCGLGEAGDLVGGNLGHGLTEQVRGAAPPGAQRQRDPVALHTRALAQRLGRLPGQVEGVRGLCGGGHGPTVGQPSRGVSVWEPPVGWCPWQT